MIGQKSIVAAALAGMVAAYDTGLPSPWNTCCNITNPSASGVTTSLANSWCMAQHNTCLELCGDNVATNNCDSGSLTYDCQCYSGNTPNISDYSQTLPSLECAYWVGLCVQDPVNVMNSTAQELCRVGCGTKNASEASTQQSSSSSSSAPSSTSSTSSSATQSAASTTATSAAPSSSGAAMPIGISREASTGLAGAVLFAVFGLFL